MTERGKWMIAALKRPDRPKRAHLMSDDRRTFCGRVLIHSRPADELGAWDPDDHPDVTCASCLEWYRAMKPKSTRLYPQPAT